MVQFISSGKRTRRKGGWFRESARHAKAARGVKTGRKGNPFAICTASVGKQHTAKWERCVRDVKGQGSPMVKKRWVKDVAGWHPMTKWGGTAPGWIYYYPKGKFRDAMNKVVLLISKTGGSNPEDKLKKEFETEYEALKFAKNYMKRN